MLMIRFQGATQAGDEYTERGPIWVNPERICAIYDHTILVDGYKIRIMETAREAVKKINEISIYQSAEQIQVR